MAMHGMGAECQPLCDRLVAQAFGDELQHLELALAESRVRDLRSDRLDRVAPQPDELGHRGEQCAGVAAPRWMDGPAQRTEASSRDKRCDLASSLERHSSVTGTV